jgi:hypothetical protein
MDSSYNVFTGFSRFFRINISLNNIIRLVLVKETQYISCAIETEFKCYLDGFQASESSYRGYSGPIGAEIKFVNIF